MSQDPTVAAPVPSADQNFVIVLYRLDELKVDVHQVAAEIRRIAEDHDMRLRKLETQVIPDIRSEIADVKGDVGKLGERLSVWQLAQATFATIVGVVASVIGIRIK